MKRITVFLATAIFPVYVSIISGCQKDQLPELSRASNGNISSNNTARIPSISNTPVSVVVKIEHQSGLSLSPSYVLAIYNNSTVEYNGISNVSYLGSLKFEMTNQQKDEINALINWPGFFAIIDTLSYSPDRPLISTTYSDTNAKTLIDYNNGYPAELINYRMQIENILDISRFVKGNPLIKHSLLPNELD